MSMHITVDINNVGIERITITRKQEWAGPRKYTYDVDYHRSQEHYTADREDVCAVVEHNFDDGSLVLIHKAITAILERP